MRWIAIAGVLVILVIGASARPGAAQEADPSCSCDSPSAAPAETPPNSPDDQPVRVARPNAITGQAGPAMAVGAHGALPAGGVQYVRNLGAHVALELAFRTTFLLVGGEAGVRAYLLKGTVSPYAALRLNVAAVFPFMEEDAHTRAVVHLAPALGFEAAERRGITASVEFYPWLGSLGWGRLWFLVFAFGYRF